MILTLLSAVLFPLAMPNELFAFGSPLVGLVALVPYYLAIRDTNDARSAARLGALFGAVSTLLGNYWLMFFGEFSVWTIGGPTVGYIVYNYVLAGFLWRASREPLAYRPVLFALVWTLYEYLKSIGFLAYPWGLAAYPFNELTLFTQIVDVTGVWGLTLVAVYANAAAAEVISPVAPLRPATAQSSATHSSATHSSATHLVVTAVLIVSIGLYGFARLNTGIPVRTTLDLLLVQQNADAWNTRDIARPLLITQQETESALAEDERQPDLIVWSETSLRYFYTEDSAWYARNPPERPFQEFISDLPAPLMTGSPLENRDDDFAIHNAVLLIDPDTRVRQWYGKQHLVPFAEIIPFWETEVVRRFFDSVVGIGGIWTPGPGTRLFSLTGPDGTQVEIATPICFEDAFAYLNRSFVLAGADLILNLTNNSWSRTNSAQTQHFVAARFRAIETRRGLVRSTNSGYTTIVDPWGRVVASRPMFVTTHLSATVPIYAPERESIYTRFGDWLPQSIAVLLAILFLGTYVRPGLRRRYKKKGALGALLKK